MEITLVCLLARLIIEKNEYITESVISILSDLIDAFLQVRTGNTTIKSDLEAFKYQFEPNAMDNGFVDERNKCFCREGNFFSSIDWVITQFCSIFVSAEYGVKFYLSRQ